MLKTLTLALVKVEPALREKAVWVWEDIWIKVQENGCHANNGLQSVR